MFLNRVEIAARLLSRSLMAAPPLVRTRFSSGPRRFHAFCVSIGRSGTQSVAHIFSHYRSVHEPFYSFTWYVLAESATGRLDTGDRRFALKLMDSLMRPEVSSAFSFNELLDDVLALYPAAKYIQCIRDCYTWLNSVFNTGVVRAERMAASARSGTYYFAQHRARYLPDLYPHPPQEKILKDHGLYSLDCYLTYWASHNQKVLDRVPADHLLVLRTRDINTSAEKFGSFLNVDPATLVMERGHANKSRDHFGLLSQIDRGHVESKVAQHCRPLMERFYPEIKSLDDAAAVS